MKISVVIPALDEECEVGAAVESALEAGDAPAGGAADRATDRATGRAVGAADIDVLVVDGGSRDATAKRARKAGARVLESPAGRARQLEVGFRACDGEAVLFLHADTRLPPGWAAAVCGALADPGVVGGAFRFAFDRRREPRLRGAQRALVAGVEWAARLRVAWLALPYGDQALFARRAVLEAIGGVPSAPVMEDLDLVKALKERGRLALLPLAAPTSPRRHLAHGVLRTALRHNLAAGAWRLGLDRERVALWVRR